MASAAIRECPPVFRQLRPDFDSSRGLCPFHLKIRADFPQFTTSLARQNEQQTPSMGENGEKYHSGKIKPHIRLVIACVFISQIVWFSYRKTHKKTEFTNFTR
jgi:hypothetical protein